MLAFAFVSLPFAGEAAPTFEKDVRPILRRHCVHCHGEYAQPKGGLDVRTVKRMAKGGESGPALRPGDAAASLLWTKVEHDEMPEGGAKMPAAEKAVLRRWLDAGAKTARPEPDDPDLAKFTPEELAHWAFQPPRPPNRPERGAALIDRLLGEKLRAAGIAGFAPEADRRTLIRRATFDLHGLPPTPAEIAAFEADRAPQAYERLIERLLASPRYGERWGRHWLDVAGYSETYGAVGDDPERPHAWRYRDYVVDSLNRDLPFDEFAREQLAGDELAPRPYDPADARTAARIAATGFLRMAPDVTGVSDTPADRNQAIADMLRVASGAFLGLTVGCAQCHDHKYDPLAADDYYRLRACFEPAFDPARWRKPEARLIDLTLPRERAEAERIEALAKARDAALDRQRDANAERVFQRELDKLPQELRAPLRAAIEAPDARRTPAQQALLKAHPTIRSRAHIRGQLVEYDPPSHRAFEAEAKKIAELRATKPPPRLFLATQDEPGPAPTTRVLLRGDVQQPGKAVAAGEPAALGGWNAPATPAGAASSGRRLALARHWTSGMHPLVARVFVNRVWAWRFGRGLVGTPGDFGLNGEAPTHPELLDALAVEFVRGGWRIKDLHRAMLHSAAYRQRSQRADAGADPERRLLARMPLRRLDAEEVRDGILLVSGQLHEQRGGPSTPVALASDGTAVVGARKLRDGLFERIDGAGAAEFRRSIYLQSRRALPLAMLETFDLPAMSPNCDARRRTTVPQQALLFLNDAFVVAQSERLAARLRKEAPDPAARLALAYAWCFGADPDAADRERCREFLARRQRDFARTAAAPPAGKGKAKPQGHDAAGAPPVDAEDRAWAALCQTLLASNRFLYVD